MEQNVEPRNKPTHYGQLLFNHTSKNTQWEKAVLGELMSICRRMKQKPYLTQLHKINFKWIKDLEGKSQNSKI